MDLALVALQYIGAAWLGAGIILAFLGSFDLIARVETNREAKSAIYWMSLIVLHPVILLQAALLALWELMKGGTR